ncbi:DUF6939 family protein [Zooshikella ganghwensis]|uniref:DUF6939 family protein n=1 Tax=Zooshikella ganghwensis TaxID=202772 RepID=UPI0004141A56|nr:hypothetical protein [Zooshikella ganghwensis]
MHQIFICSKRKKIETLSKEYPDAEIIDVTSKAAQPWVKFSPFYPHGNIPIPFSEGHYSYSVEGLWQGLKVFKSQDVDSTKFKNQSMKGIKRTVRKLGVVLGHRKGVNSPELLSYLDARRLIYIPSYQYILSHFLQNELRIMKGILRKKDIVLLDYETNTSIENLKKPLSHASLIASFIKSDSF